MNGGPTSRNEVPAGFLAKDFRARFARLPIRADFFSKTLAASPWRLSITTEPTSPKRQVNAQRLVDGRLNN